ncbi:protein FRIGIDA-ESSENTIAL 1-like [Apium graveolens]|uniref:protein FRIGIDA-ESSENTIAL 1-like n=1 Tax=Apium graveolens TaxID=4045 RepID=UPI003D7934EC
MDLPAFDENGKTCKATNCGTTKYDLGENSSGISKARRNRPCKYFASGYCRRGNYCWFSHYYQKPYNFNNYKTYDQIKYKHSRVYIVPGREGLKCSGTVSGPDIAAASGQYDPLTDSWDLIRSIISEQEAEAELGLSRTDDLDGDGLHGTDSNDVELMAANVERHQSSEEQFPDCTDEIQNILKDEEMTERKDGSKVVNTEGNAKADDRERITNGKGLRAFKFALTDFVKGLLSPTWNQQKIDRETYKTISKKVVKKVIFSVQSTRVPQTQEDINHYLAVSKAKISKLVQAYLEMVKKGKAIVA